MKKIVKKTMASAMALTLIAGAVPCDGCGFNVLKPAIVTHAAEATPSILVPNTNSSEDSVVLNEETGVLTLSGYIQKDAVQAYAGNNAVKKVVCEEGTSLPDDCEEMFKNFNASEIDLSNADSSKVKGTVKNMFYNCTNLQKLNLGDFDTSKVVYMSGMFQNCSSLTELDLASFDTELAAVMDNMYNNCTALKRVYVSDEWTTANVVSSNNMFAGCNSIIGAKDTAFSNDHTDAGYAHYDSDDAPGYLCKHCCSYNSDTSTLTISGDIIREDIFTYRPLKVKRVIVEDGAVFPADSSYVFGGFCYAEDITFGNVDTNKVTNMFEMFESCYEIRNLDLSSFDTRNVTNMGRMFLFCEKLESIDLSSFDTSKVTNMNGMFGGCYHLNNLDLSKFDTSNVTDMSGFLSSCGELTAVDVSSFNTSKVTTMSEMFWACKNLRSLDLSNFDTSNVTTMKTMFLNCYALSSLDLSNFDTSSLTNTHMMFSGCKGLTSLNLSSFNTSKVTDMRGMFAGCESLKTLDLTNFDTSNVTSMREMFAVCKNLESLDLSRFDTSKVVSMNAMFQECSSLKSLDLSSFNTGSLNDICYMFWKCYSIEKIDLSSFETTKFDSNPYALRSMYETFASCGKLNTIYVSDKWVTPTKKSNYTFAGCNALLGQNGTPYNPSYVNSDYARIDGKDGKQGYFTDISKVSLKITTQPVDKSGVIGDKVKFTVEAAGDNLSYQWQYLKGNEWVNSTLTGSKTNTLSVVVTEARNGLKYRCVIITPDVQLAISDEATLTVNTKITKQPTAASGTVGDKAKFTVTATGAKLTYQWQYLKGNEWVNSTLTGSKTNTLSVGVTEARNGLKYRCVIKDANGDTFTSTAAKLTVNTKITNQPVDASGNIGDKAKFTVNASGAGLTYQWQYLKGKEWINSTLIGSKTNTLSVGVTEARNGLKYRCIIKDANGKTLTSSTATLTVKK